MIVEFRAGGVRHQTTRGQIFHLDARYSREQVDMLEQVLLGVGVSPTGVRAVIFDGEQPPMFEWSRHHPNFDPVTA